VLVRELAEWLGFSRADSVRNLTRRLEANRKALPEPSKDPTKVLRQAWHFSPGGWARKSSGGWA
jgi:hypothetical protein